MIFKSGRKASPLTSLLDIILLVLFAQNIISSDLAFKKAENEIDVKYREEIKNKEEIIKKKEDTIKDKNNEIDDINSKYFKDINEKNDEINKLKILLDSSKSNLESADSKNKELTKVIASNSLEIKSLKEKNATLDSCNNQLKQDIESKKEENDKLFADNKTLKEKNASLDSSNNQLKQDIESKKEENDKLIADNKTLKEKNASLDSSNNQLKQNIENKKLENERLVKDNKTLKEKNTSLDSSNNQLKHVIESKKEENKKLQDEINDTELPVALKTQIDELKRFVEDNYNDLNQVDEAKKLVSVRKILTSAKALEQLKNLITVVEVRLDKDKITISLDGFEEKLNWPDKEELAKDKFDDEVIKDLSEKFIEKMSKLFDSARRSKSHARVLLIPSLDKSKLPNVCWRFFYKMYSSKNLYDTSFIKELYMPDNYIHIKE